MYAVLIYADLKAYGMFLMHHSACLWLTIQCLCLLFSNLCVPFADNLLWNSCHWALQIRLPEISGKDLHSCSSSARGDDFFPPWMESHSRFSAVCQSPFGSFILSLKAGHSHCLLPLCTLLSFAKKVPVWSSWQLCRLPFPWWGSGKFQRL